MTRWLAPALTLCAASLYWLAVARHSAAATPRVEQLANVVVAGPAQVFLYGGDRFLAANIESIRAAAASTAPDSETYRLRAHQTVSRLNPCHEDNYWIGNAALSWGGAKQQGLELLGNATRCRYWDEWPPFFYAFNQNFFHHNVPEAQRALELAAERSQSNAAGFRTFSLMLAAGEIDDTRMALEMLQAERDKAKDPKLRAMLDRRVGRVAGLLALRDAQAAFEKRFGRPLAQPQELLSSGLLQGFPDDPMKLGYEFRGHAFHLHEPTAE